MVCWTQSLTPSGYELPARLEAERIVWFYDMYENTLKTHEDLRDTVG